ncbi:MAG: MFS transporter [Sphingomonadaceae bacterium]|jgi:MFS family permease
MQGPVAFFRRLKLVPQGFTIVLAGFLPVFAIVSMFPALPGIIEHFKDNPNARDLVPLMVSAPGLTIALVAPFAGWFVDRFGRLKLLVWSTFFYGFFGTAPFFLDDLTQLFATRLGLGVCEAFILTIVNTLIGDYWEDEGRRDWLFLQGITGPFFASGLILIAGPATEIRWNGIFLVYSVAFLIFIAMKVFLFEPKSDEGERAIPDVTEPAPADASPFPTAAIASIVAVTLLASALYYVFIISGSLVFQEVGVKQPSQISEMTAVPSLFILLGALIFRLMGGRSNAFQLGAVFAVLCIGLLGMGLAGSAAMVVVFLCIQQTGAGMTVPTLIAWAQTKLPFAHRGRGMGVWTAAFFFGQFSSPWFVSRIEDLFDSTQAAFALLGGIGLVAAVIAFANAILGKRAAQAA